MKQDAGYERRAGGSGIAVADAILAPVNSRGRVWAISIFATTAAAAQALIRNGTTTGGPAIYRVDAPAVIGDGISISFPQGLYFDNGLFVDMIAGVPVVSVCFSLDGRSDS